MPIAACSTLRAISPVAAVCCCTADATDVPISLIPPITWAIEPIARTASAVPFCTRAIRPMISSVAWAVWLARPFTSLATTAKPRPASPARAASIVAFSANKLVCAAMFLINETISPIPVTLPASF